MKYPELLSILAAVNISIAPLLVTLTFLIGCGTLYQPSGPAFGQEGEFRRQLLQSTPVVKWGCTIDSIKFSQDYEKATVSFLRPALPGLPSTNLNTILKHHGFRRYSGIVTDDARQAADAEQPDSERPKLNSYTTRVPVTLSTE